MVESVNVFQDGRGLFGGFRGFLDRSFGNENSNNRPLSGLLDRNTVGFRSNPLQLPSNPLLQQIEQQKQNERTEGKKKDEVELSNFVKDAAEEAVQKAGRSPGATSQVFVSEDGRFEVSVDLQVRGDGSFDLGLAVGFAQSRGAALQSETIPANESDAESDAATENTDTDTNENGTVPSQVDPAALPLLPAFSNSALGSIERFTSFEQSLSTRDLQVDIFFEEAKSVAFKAEQRFGTESAEQFNALAGQISNEFRLNINISGNDINNFNQAANDLLQFDNTGTLNGFLSAASNVLSNSSSDIGAFVDATRALVGSARDHVSAKLNDFFTGLNSQFGNSLEELGFEPGFLQNIGADVENDLNNFFSITNELLANLAGKREEIEDRQNQENSELEILEESLQRLRERQQKEQIGIDLTSPPRPENTSTDTLGNNPQSLRDLLASLAEEQNRRRVEPPVDTERSAEIDGEPVLA